MENKIFISWSGEKAKIYADFLVNLLNKVFNENEKIFYSKRIIEGKMWIQEISDALRISKVGIILVTREDVSKPWLNFEAGALYKGKQENYVIPIFIDISEKSIADHPLRLFQSKYHFDKKGILQLCGFIYKELGWKHELNWDTTIERMLNEFRLENDDIIREDIVEEYIFEKNIPIYEKNKSFVAELPSDIFGEIRKRIIVSAKGKIILAGQSLDEAFSEGTDMSIINILRENIINKRISEISILVVDPTMFSNVDKYEIGTPLSRVAVTMNTLITEILPVCKKNNCKTDIYFVPLLEIDHAIISNNFMGFRSTKLWTVDGKFKGDFSLYRNIGVPNSEYDAHKKYLEKLMSTSIALFN